MKQPQLNPVTKLQTRLLGDPRESPRLIWTPLSRRLAVTRTAEQRTHILDAVDRMAWSCEVDSALAQLGGGAAHAILSAAYRERRACLRLIGISALPDSRRLIGARDADGARSYFLESNAEVIQVLTTVGRGGHPGRETSRSVR